MFSREGQWLAYQLPNFTGLYCLGTFIPRSCEVIAVSLIKSMLHGNKSVFDVYKSHVHEFVSVFVPCALYVQLLHYAIC